MGGVRSPFCTFTVSPRLRLACERVGTGGAGQLQPTGFRRPHEHGLRRLTGWGRGGHSAAPSFPAKKYKKVTGKEIYSDTLESTPMLEKEKFPQDYFPEVRGVRGGGGGCPGPGSRWLRPSAHP